MLNNTENQKALWYVEQIFAKKHNAFFSFLEQGTEKNICGRQFLELPLQKAEDLSAPIFVLDKISSTLDMMHELSAQEKLVPFTSVVCREQTEGRGQLRRSWQSMQDNLYIALVLPKKPPFDTDAAAPAFGAMTAYALQELGFAAEIKWPNDLVQKTDRGYAKVGGILLEERNDVLVAGMGINCFSAPDDSLMRDDFMLSASKLKNFQDSVMKEKFLKNFENSLVAEKNNISSEILLPIEKIEKNNNFWLILGFWLALVKEIKLCYEKTLLSGKNHIWNAIYKKYLAFLGDRVLIRDVLPKNSRIPERFYSGDIANAVSGQIVGLGQDGELLLLVDNDIIEIVGGSITRYKG